MPAKPDPIEIGEAKRFEIVELKGPGDLVEVVREEIARALTFRDFEFLQLSNAPPDLQLRVTVEGWDYFESKPMNQYRERTATMNLCFEVIEPQGGRVLVKRTYVGVDSGREEFARTITTETGLGSVRRAAANAATKFVNDLAVPDRILKDAAR
jgi:hypothetical protein